MFQVRAPKGRKRGEEAHENAAGAASSLGSVFPPEEIDCNANFISWSRTRIRCDVEVGEDSSSGSRRLYGGTAQELKDMASTSLRSKVSDALPAPVARLARRMLLWKRRSAFRPYPITKRIDGETLPFWIGDETAEAWYRPEKDPVHQELAFIRDHMLSPGDLVFDVGSHHGLHTLHGGIAAGWWRLSRIHITWPS